MRALPTPRLVKVRKAKAKTLSGYEIERTEIREKDRVHIKITRPGERLAFKLTMTYDEWREFKK